MPTALRLRRGTTAQHATFTGLAGEATVDTSKNTLVVHDGVTAGGIAMARGDTLGIRNRIINGDMRIDQRNNGAAVTTLDGAYFVDRYRAFNVVNGKLSYQQNLGGILPPVGFSNYVGVTCISTHVAAPSDYFFFRQSIEGTNTADFAFGTAQAQPITVSFLVRSNTAGNRSGSILNASSSRSWVFPFSINSVDTWEKKTITIPGDVLGTWPTGTGTGLLINFDLGSGSNYATAANSWQGAERSRVAGDVSIVATLNANFLITGLQLEAGSVATPFERRPIGLELSLCQRYALVIPVNSFFATGTQRDATTHYFFLPTPVTMRASPSVSGPIGTIYVGNNTALITGWSGWNNTVTGLWSGLLTTTGIGAAGSSSFLYSSGGPVVISAEL